MGYQDNEYCYRYFLPTSSVVGRLHVLFYFYQSILSLVIILNVSSSDDSLEDIISSSIVLLVFKPAYHTYIQERHTNL